jgi:diaminopimelate epimerase
MPKLVVEFTKMNGAGNDFIVLDNRFYHFSDDELSDIARRFCPRRTGIGADGLLALNVPLGDADFRMRYINADGSVGTMCGNGARCIAHFAHLAGVAGEPLRFETDAGPHVAHDAHEGSALKIEMVSPRDVREESLNDLGGVDATYVWTGTEHAVVLVRELTDGTVDTLGPQIRRHPAFSPAGVNVNFVQVVSDTSLQACTYEKGVEAMTLACGTGAVAAAFVAAERGLVKSGPVSVNVPGGQLIVHLPDPAQPESKVMLEGPVEVIYRGSFEW